jgi:hypothetical protein
MLNAERKTLNAERKMQKTLNAERGTLNAECEMQKR